MFGLVTSARIQALEERVRVQDEVVRALCAATGVDAAAADPITSLDDAERDMVASGKKVEAMKHHRERTGSSLTQAHDAVERAVRS